METGIKSDSTSVSGSGIEEDKINMYTAMKHLHSLILIELSYKRIKEILYILSSIVMFSLLLYYSGETTVEFPLYVSVLTPISLIVILLINESELKRQRVMAEVAARTLFSVSLNKLIDHVSPMPTAMENKNFFDSGVAATNEERMMLELGRIINYVSKRKTVFNIGKKVLEDIHAEYYSMFNAIHGSFTNIGYTDNKGIKPK